MDWGMNYESENCAVESLADMSVADAEKLIGKTIKRVDAKECGITLTFADGSEFVVDNGSWHGSNRTQIRFVDKQRRLRGDYRE